MRPKCKYTHLWITQEYVVLVVTAAVEQQDSLVYLRLDLVNMVVRPLLFTKSSLYTLSSLVKE